MKAFIFAVGLAVLFAVCTCQDCEPDYYKCQNDKCIPGAWICDGMNDCGDWSDERDENGTCPDCIEGEFIEFWKCGNGRCIWAEYVCNGDNDCGDAEASDESQNCPPCSVYEDRPFQCRNGACMIPSKICNGYDDCRDGSDEADENGNCPACPDGVFVCQDGRCLDRDTVCNGRNDCGDWSDEEDDICPCEVRCSNPVEGGRPGACVPPEWVCDDDGIWDCPRGEDEANCTIY